MKTALILTLALLGSTLTFADTTVFNCRRGEEGLVISNQFNNRYTGILTVYNVGHVSSARLHAIPMNCTAQASGNIRFSCVEASHDGRYYYEAKVMTQPGTGRNIVNFELGFANAESDLLYPIQCE